MAKFEICNTGTIKYFVCQTQFIVYAVRCIVPKLYAVRAHKKLPFSLEKRPLQHGIFLLCISLKNIAVFQKHTMKASSVQLLRNNSIENAVEFKQFRYIF